MDRKTVLEMGKRYPTIGPMLDIRFKKEGIEALRLLYCHDRGYVILENKFLAEAVIRSSHWESDQNRTVRAYFPTGLMWRNLLFQDKIAEGIESIRLTSMHRLNVLMTGRKKVQDDNSARIINECCSSLNIKDLSEFGLKLESKFEIVCGLPQITFKLEAPDETVSTIILDGWSGQMIVDGVPQQKAFGSPKEFHKIVEDKAFEYADRITA
jgi:hypothetical protein